MSRWFTVVIAALMLAAAGHAADNRPMNVLLIVSDDLTPRLGCLGYDQVKTPNIDRLARRGVLFERAYCQFPLCAPSRASFMTGLRPETSGVLTNATHIRDNQPDCITMGQLFRNNGYVSARVGKIFHYGVPKEIGTDGSGDDEKTWDIRINPAGKDVDDEDTIINYMPRPGRHPDGRPQLGAAIAWRSDEGPDDLQTDGKVASETIRLMRENRDRPFFLACGFYRPHVPSVAPSRWFELYPFEQVQLPREPAEHVAKIPPVAMWVPKPNYGIADDDMRRFTRAYLATISFMDAQVGRVLDALEELGLADRTIVVFTSDHGWLLGEHGGQWQKMSLFEMSAKVPLIIAAPGAAGNGQKSGRTVELIDILPTVADLCGLKAPAAVQGASLRPLLEDPAASWDRPAYTIVSRGVRVGTDQARGKRKGIMGRSVRTERYRYTEWGPDGQHGAELYDYQSDPNEWNNLADDPAAAAVRQQLKRLLTAQR